MAPNADKCDLYKVSGDARWLCGLNMDQATAVVWDLSKQDLTSTPKMRFELNEPPTQVKSLDVFSLQLPDAALISVLATRGEANKQTDPRSPVSIWQMSTRESGGDAVTPKTLVDSQDSFRFAWDSDGVTLAGTSIYKGPGRVLSWSPQYDSQRGDDSVRVSTSFEQPTTRSSIAVVSVQLTTGGPYAMHDTCVVTGDTEGNLHALGQHGELLKIPGHDNAILELTPIPDTSLVVSGSLDRSVRIWDLGSETGFDSEIDAKALGLETGIFLQRAVRHQRADRIELPLKLSLDRNTKRYIIGESLDRYHHHKRVSLFDLQDPEPWSNAIPISEISETCLVLPGSRQLAVVGRSPPIIVGLDDPKSIGPFMQNRKYASQAFDVLRSMAGGLISPSFREIRQPGNSSPRSRLLKNGQYVLLRSHPPSLWRLEEKGPSRLEATFTDGWFRNTEEGLLVSPDENWIVTNSEDDGTALHRVGANESYTLLDEGSLGYAAICNHSKWLAVVQDETSYEDQPRVFVWSLSEESFNEEPRLVFESPKIHNSHLLVASADDQSYVIIASDEGIQATNIADGKTFTLANATGRPQLVGPHRLATESSDGGGLVFDIRDLKKAPLQFGAQATYWSGDGTWFASVKLLQSTSLFRRSEEGFKMMIKQKSQGFGIVAFSPDGSWAAEHVDRKVYLWYLGAEDGVPEPLEIDVEHGMDTGVPFFSPDARWLVLAGTHKSIVWPITREMLTANAATAAGRRLEHSTGPIPIGIELRGS